MSSDTDPNDRSSENPAGNTGGSRHAGPAGEAPRGDDSLGQLEERLDRASQAAERLIADAAARMVSPPVGDAESTARTTRRIPPAGWQRPRRAGQEPSAQRPEAEEHTAGNAGSSGEFEALLHALGALRHRIPPELQHRLGEALREVLLALRALIDWYLERTERPWAEPSDIEDIPIL